MLAMAPKNHPNQRRRRGALDDVDDRETPGDVYNPLNAEFGFTLDVCAARHNAKCRRYYSLAPGPAHCPRQLSFLDSYVGDPDAVGYDGLVLPWERHEVIWCNPPFSDLEPWVMRASFVAATVVMLLPANRCEQPFWQRWVEPFRDKGIRGLPETRFLAGRRVFKNKGVPISNRTSRNPPFGVVIVVWDRRGDFVTGPANDNAGLGH